MRETLVCIRKTATGMPRRLPGRFSSLLIIHAQSFHAHLEGVDSQWSRAALDGPRKLTAAGARYTPLYSMPPSPPLPPSPPPLPPAFSWRPIDTSQFATAATRSSLEPAASATATGEIKSETGGVASDSWLLADLQIPPERQTGPTCGLVALHMATRALHANASASSPGVTELLAAAAERGFSTQVSQRGCSIRVRSHHTPSCAAMKACTAISHAAPLNRVRCFPRSTWRRWRGRRAGCALISSVTPLLSTCASTSPPAGAVPASPDPAPGPLSVRIHRCACALRERKRSTK